MSLTKNNVKKVYLGVSEGEFKKNRYCYHQPSFQNKNYNNSTTWSTFLWSIKSTSNRQNVNLSYVNNVNKATGCSLFQHFKAMLVMFA